MGEHGYKPSEAEKVGEGDMVLTAFSGRRTVKSVFISGDDVTIRFTSGEPMYAKRNTIVQVAR